MFISTKWHHSLTLLALMLPSHLEWKGTPKINKWVLLGNSYGGLSCLVKFLHPSSVFRWMCVCTHRCLCVYVCVCWGLGGGLVVGLFGQWLQIGFLQGQKAKAKQWCLCCPLKNGFHSRIGEVIPASCPVGLSCDSWPVIREALGPHCSPPPPSISLWANTRVKGLHYSFTAS